MDELLYMKATGLHSDPQPEFTSCEDYSYESLLVTINNIQLLNAYQMLQAQMTSEKIKMIKKIRANYAHRLINNNVMTSAEALYDKEIQSCEGIISSVFGLCIKILGQVIKFIGKVITWILEAVLRVISGIIGFITRRKTPPKEKVSNWFAKAKRIMQGKESLDRGTEDNVQKGQVVTPGIEHANLMQKIIEYAKQYIKTKEQYNKSSFEEIFFYKLFLINGDPKNIKYACDVFNRGATKVKDEGTRLSNLGAKLLVDLRPTASSSESMVQSTEETREQELERFGQFFIQSGIVNLKEHDPKRDFIEMLYGLEKSILYNEDAIWMRKFYNIFKNGAAEMTKVNKDLQAKLNELKGIDPSKLKDIQQKTIQNYQYNVNNFQKFIGSYSECIRYFTKYYQIRATIIGKFKDDIDRYDQNKAA